MDDENIIKTMKLLYICYKTYIYLKSLNRRRWWVRELNLTRDENGFFAKSYKHLKEKDYEHFIKITRMTKATYDVLFNLIKPKLQKNSHRKPIAPDCRLFLTLM